MKKKRIERDARSFHTEKRPCIRAQSLQSCLTLCGPCVTPRTIAHQVLQSIGFSGQEYWSGLLFPSPGNLPNLGIKPGSPALQVDSLPFEPRGKHPSLAFVGESNWENFRSSCEKDLLEYKIKYWLQRVLPSA